MGRKLSDGNQQLSPVLLRKLDSPNHPNPNHKSSNIDCVNNLWADIKSNKLKRHEVISDDQKPHGTFWFITTANAGSCGKCQNGSSTVQTIFQFIVFCVSVFPFQPRDIERTVKWSGNNLSISLSWDSFVTRNDLEKHF